MSSSTPTNAADLGRGEARPPRGRLKVFLGYAAGVGKTYRMLEEVHVLLRHGKDVVVGYFEPHGRKDTIAKIVGLEMIPRRVIDYRGVKLEEMDTPAILARHPAICAVDELPHTNVPGAERQKRWEDVQFLLDAGIDVMTTMNIQHLESLNDQVFHITGVRVRETVPDWFVKSADEVIMVDATTGALLNRLKRGDIYAPEKAQRAMDNFFKESTLAALRELALRQTAHELEVRETTDLLPDIASELSAASPRPKPQVQESILIYVTEDPSTAMLIRRGRRMADYLGAECFAVCVASRRARRSAEANDTIEKHLNFARNLHIETRNLEGEDPADVILEFARRNQVTVILLARPKQPSWTRFFGGDLILQIVRNARDIRVIIVAERHRQAPSLA